MKMLFLMIALVMPTNLFAGQKYDYNLEEGSKDFAELSMDVSSRQAIGKSVRISVKSACSSPEAKTDRTSSRQFPTVFCLDKSMSSFYVTGSKGVRLNMMKIGSGEVVWFNGRVVGEYGSAPIIEFEAK